MCLREFILIFLLTSLMIIALWFIMPVRREMNEKQALLRELKIENQELEKELTDLRRENTKLQSEDPYSLQRVARETYDYCYPGEKIYKFPKHSNPTEIQEK